MEGGLPSISVEAVKNDFSAGLIHLDLSDGSALAVSFEYLPPEYQGAFLCPGISLSCEAEAALCFSAACVAAQEAALRLVAIAEQCSAGLLRKLQQRKHSTAAAREVLSRLVELNLVNDLRFAELWLKSRISRGTKSPRILVSSLRSKGLEKTTCTEALKLALNDGQEKALLRRFLEKNKLKAGDSALRQILRREGFGAQVIEQFYEETME